MGLISETTKGIPVHGLVHIYVYCMARVVFSDMLSSVEGACVAAVRHWDAEEEGLSTSHLFFGILLPAGIKLLCLAAAVEDFRNPKFCMVLSCSIQNVANASVPITLPVPVYLPIPNAHAVHGVRIWKRKKKKRQKPPKPKLNWPNKTKTRKRIRGCLKAQPYIEYE